ncbi:Gliding motility regulatory protein [compost metagenome]
MRIHYNIFDTLLEPVFVLNVEQKVIYCNETAATVCGLSIRKITRGMKFLELFEFSEPIDTLKSLISVCDPTPYKEVSFKTPLGGEGKIQLTLQPVFDQMGDKAWVVFVRDVTLEERLQKKYRAELEQKEDVIKALEDAKVQLEDYSKNLEVMVAERTKELSRLNQTMSALLDSLGQGFFIFNADGKVLDVTSKACENTIECNPQGLPIWETLKIPENKVEGFKKWMTTVFMEMLPFEDLSPLGPTTFPHSKGKSISLEYHPLRSNEGAMEGVVVVASDITSLVEAQQQAERERESAKLIIHLVQSKKEIARFVREAQDMLADLHDELSKPQDRFDQEALFRALHTLKGGAALFSISEMAESCHQAETLLAKFQEKSSAESYSDLNTKCQEVDHAFHSFLESSKGILGTSAFSQDRQIEVPYSKLNDMIERVSKLPGGGSMAQIVLSELVMEPVGSFFTAYGDVALRLAEKQEKMLFPLEIENAELPVLPEIYTPLFGSFVHAFRNAVDHGIEAPGVRENAGKDAHGKITVSFQTKTVGGHQYLAICVKDDGGGVNPERIRKKLKAKGVSLAHETDHQVIQHIFDSQFSTREEVTETSGRGVGMDAIKTAAEQLGGKAWVESELTKGTSLIVEVPYLTSLPAEKKATAA